MKSIIKLVCLDSCQNDSLRSQSKGSRGIMPRLDRRPTSAPGGSVGQFILQTSQGEGGVTESGKDRPREALYWDGAFAIALRLREAHPEVNWSPSVWR